MQKQSIKCHVRILCMIMVLALILAQVPATWVFAESTPAYEWAGGSAKPQLDFHNNVCALSYDQLKTLFEMGATDVFQVVQDGTVVWNSLTDTVSENPKDLLMAEDNIYEVQIGSLKMPSWKPSSWYYEYTSQQVFTVRVYDILSVKSNIPELVTVDGQAVNDTFALKVYRVQNPQITVSMGDLMNYTVSATVDGETILNNAGTYVFSDGLTKDTTVNVVYVEDTESKISLGDVSGCETIDFPVTAPAESVVAITATPNSSYYIDKVIVKNGNNVVDVDYAYDNGVWVGAFVTTAQKSNYTIDCISKPILKLTGEVMGYNSTMGINEIRDSIYACIDQNNSAPLFSNIDKLTFEYNASNFDSATWKPLDYTPSGLDALKTHAFGHGDNEMIRISYNGDGRKYSDGRDVFNVRLVDTRSQNAAIDVQEEITVVYGSYTTDDLIDYLLDGHKGVYDIETGKKIDGAKIELSMDLTKVPAGQYDVSIRFVGNSKYVACESASTIIVAKAPASISVGSDAIIPQNEFNIDSLVDVSPENIGYISFVFGVDAIEQNTIMQIDISNMLHVNSTLQPIVDAILNSQNNKTFTLDELESIMTKLSEVDTQIDLSYIDQIIGLVKEIDQFKDIGDVEIVLTTDGRIKASNVGAYLVGAATSDVNYEFAADFGYLVVQPDATKVTLEFNADINPIITYNEAVYGAYDMGAHVVEECDAGSKVVNVFCGISSNGEIYFSDVAPKNLGAYTQLAYIGDLGNQMYYATPIIRTYVISPELVNVVFVNKNGEEANRFKYTYDGDDKPAFAVATNKNGAVLNESDITYTYVGISAAGETYRSNQAPSEAGVYTVIAVYTKSDSKAIGSAIASLIIDQADSEFVTHDVTTVFDGTGKFVKVTNPNDLEYISVIVNGNNINILLPKSWDVESQNLPLDDVAARIFDMANCVTIHSNDPDAIDIVSNLVSALEEIDDYDVEINGDKPFEVGTYDVYSIAFGSNYKTTVANSLLTITKKDDKVDPADPTIPSNPENPANPTNPTDPTDPTLPDDVLNPDAPVDPTGPNNPNNDDNSTAPVLGYDGTSSIILWGTIALLATAAVVVEIYVLKTKKTRNED